ncbi:isochorismate synthase DhbC [Halobacillus salinarum]|uniref:isochorismate synthase n=1 Tax=Halobacillus salinarum TaxID=2932257 RepID=A0ABY4EDR4_9BACI|nr:isochorismate synthase DhbC [Halobacillus salinarum]UOQ42591.1 isochorismate synthase DhbC [Halobacillus salinarum]
MSQSSVSEHTKESLVHRYEAGDFLLSTPQQTMLGKGMLFKVTPIEKSYSKLQDMVGSIENALIEAEEKGIDHPVVAGAIPFDTLKSPHLFVPEHVEISTTQAEKLNMGGHVNQTEDASFDMHSSPEPTVYKKAVNKGIEYIKNGELSKIVLSRSLTLTSPRPLNVQDLVFKLSEHNPKGYTFAVDLPVNEKDRSLQKRRTFIGASPELLVAKSGNVVTANPLAGSRPRSSDPVQDKKNAEELLTSQKDLHEHAVVIDQVAQTLKPYCSKFNVPDHPSVISTETMWHLSTEIEGELTNPHISAIELAGALHPTPAICGEPAGRAKEKIKEIEPFDRGFFTGMTGWCDSSGNGEWIVSIRCAEVFDKSIRLFAGAGVVAGSKADEELAETSAKFKTMLNAIGIHQL